MNVQSPRTSSRGSRRPVPPARLSMAATEGSNTISADCLCIRRANSTEISHRGHRGRRGNPLAVLRGLCDPCESQFSTASYECTVEWENWYKQSADGLLPNATREPENAPT